MKPLRVIDKDFNNYGEVPLYASLQIRTKHIGVGELDLVINRYMPNVDALQMGRIIFLDGDLDNPYEILKKAIKLDEKGKETEDWEIKALSTRKWMEDRVFIPEGATKKKFAASEADILFIAILRTEVLEPKDERRKLPNFKWGKLVSNTPKFEYELERYKALSDAFDEISQESGVVGWRIAIDNKDKTFRFDAYKTTNRSYSQTDVSPVIFSPEFRTLQTAEYTEDETEYKNVAIILGQGEGLDRHMAVINSEASGFERRELYVDARDVEDTYSKTTTTTVLNENGEPEELTVTADVARDPESIRKELLRKGNDKLETRMRSRYFSGQVQNSSFIYKRDWFIGDIVTVEHREWNMTLDAQVTEVLEVHEAGKPYTVEVVFDHGIPTLIDKLKGYGNAGNGGGGNTYYGPSYQYVNQQVSKADIIEGFTFVRDENGAVTAAVGDVDTHIEIKRDESGNAQAITDLSQSWNRIATYGFERTSDGAVGRVNVQAIPIVEPGSEED